MTEARERELAVVAARILPSLAAQRMPGLPEQIELGAMGAEEQAFVTGFVAGSVEAERRLGARRPGTARRSTFFHPVWHEKARRERMESRKAWLWTWGPWLGFLVLLLMAWARHEAGGDGPTDYPMSTDCARGGCE